MTEQSNPSPERRDWLTALTKGSQVQVIDSETGEIVWPGGAVVSVWVAVDHPDGGLITIASGRRFGRLTGKAMTPNGRMLELRPIPPAAPVPVAVDPQQRIAELERVLGQIVTMSPSSAVCCRCEDCQAQRALLAEAEQLLERTTR